MSKRLQSYVSQVCDNLPRLKMCESLGAREKGKEVSFVPLFSVLDIPSSPHRLEGYGGSLENMVLTSQLNPHFGSERVPTLR